MTISLFFAIAVIALAYTVRGIAGFGSALVAVPVLALVFPLPAVVPVLCLTDLFASAAQCFQNRRAVQWGEAVMLLPATLIGMTGGLLTLRFSPPGILAVALGAFIFLYALYALLPFPELSGGRRWSAPAGVIGGFVSAVFGTGGPFYVIYFHLRQFNKSAFRATAAAVFLAEGVLRTIGYLTTGTMDSPTVLAAFAVLPVAAGGLAVGHRLHLRMQPVRFVLFVNLVLLGAGLALIVRHGGGLFP